MTLAFINEFSVEAIRDALQKLDDFTNLKVNGLNAFQLNELEKIDPLLFSEVAKRITEGKWFPNAGMWAEESEKITAKRLARNVLYSQTYLKENFGVKYRVFQGKTVYNPDLAQVAYAAGFDACVINDEKDVCWLASADESRLLLCPMPETADINEIDDDFINANQFSSVEEYALEFYAKPLDVKVKSFSFSVPEDETEEMVLTAEKVAVQEKENTLEEIQNCWIQLFLHNAAAAAELAKEIIAGRSFDPNFIKTDAADIQLIAVKSAEDGSGDTVIRVKETAGKEKTVNLICDPVNAGFRFQAEPYELQTFRADSEGFVTEVLITE